MRLILVSVVYLVASLFGNAAFQTVPLPSSGGVPYGPTPQVFLPTTPYGNTVPQTVPGMAPGGVASASTLSTPAAGILPYGTPVAPVVAVVPSPPGVPGPAIGVSPPAYGPQPSVPPNKSSSWASNACKYYGLKCEPLDSCAQKLRLPLSGCDNDYVCCNWKKTKHCSKVGGQCRMKCKGYEIPYKYAKCTLNVRTCCIKVQQKKF
ncbi:uncharacterized protein LOC119383695 [Rhipicephalus sanguineus]|uniref:uncharacterized protein LOC119383695 n=1 Tax=Rhipicephalus sanguineus TaxID=34632 RepID=UPI001892FFCC|nr:uncharacterized protein LOC119383695 [Rhipicephalus sanguineus]